MKPKDPRAATLAEVAKRAGVSTMTVSRVMNGASTVSSFTRERVREAIATLDYRPNPAARRLAGGGDLRIGIIYANPSRSYLSELLLGAITATSHNGLRLELATAETGESACSALHKLLADGVSGIIVPPPLSEAPDILDALDRTEIDAVMIAGAVGTHDAIKIHDLNAAADMTRLLIEMGHRRIGFIAGDPNQGASAARLMGYRRALEDADLRIEDALIVDGRFTFESGLAATTALLDLSTRPSAIMASNDDMAAAAVFAALRAGLRVPEDLSVTGFDDTVVATTVFPALTTVQQPIAAMAAQAVERLLARARSKVLGEVSAPATIFMPYKLIVRGSTTSLLDCEAARFACP